MLSRLFDRALIKKLVRSPVRTATPQSLARRFGTLFLIGNGLTLACAFFGFLFVGAYFSKSSFETEIRSVARILATTSRAVLAFDDRAGCTRVLNSLSSRPDVGYAALIRADRSLSCEIGEIHAASQDFASATAGESSRWTSRSLLVSQPVTLDGDTLGYLLIDAHIDGLLAQFVWLIPIALSVALGSIVGASLVTRRLKESLSTRLGSLENFARDISETKDLSGRLAQQHGYDEVDSLISSFNTMLAELEERNRSLTQAKNRAEQADQAKSLFVASMSHELRTPLHAILTIADEVLETKLNADQRDLLSVLQSSGKSLLSIINDVLDFSKIEAGRMTLEEKQFSLRAFMQRTAKMFALSFKQKGVVLSYSVLAHVPDCLMGDEHRIGQILVNLLGNALKFTPAGGAVHCRVTLDESDSSELLGLHFSVEDTGIGIVPEKLSHIFEPFTQAHPKTSTLQGTGLGLAITRRLVDAMSGRTWVESVPGVGSTFHVVVGCRLGTEEREVLSGPTANHESYDEAENQISKTPSGPLILVVDDHPVNRKLAQRVLEKKGYRILLAEHGLEALELIQRTPEISVVLMDIDMPIMDGLESTLKIRDWERSKELRAIPIVALTASVHPDDAQKCLDVGMDAFLMKPFDREKLLATVEGYSAQPPSHSSPA